MEHIRIVSFPLQPVADPYHEEDKPGQSNPPKARHFPVNWKSKESQILSESLNNEVKNGSIDYHQLVYRCKHENTESLYTSDFIDDHLVIFKDYHLLPEQQKKLCKSFLPRITDTNHSPTDVLVFTNQYQGILYAVVVLYREEYFGHIYSWVSPTVPNFCFTMGYRKRSDAIFRVDKLNDIYLYLLEGVRQLALSKGCTSLAIVWPNQEGVDLLTPIGFVRTNKIRYTTVGADSIGGNQRYSASEYFDCLAIDDISTTFLTIKVENFD